MHEEQRLPFTAEQAKAWRDTIPTPFYVYDEAGISACATNLHKAFSWNKGFKEYFAVKATPTPALIRLLASHGCGVDCASLTELILAEKCGIVGENIMFSSNETRGEEYRAAARLGAIINLDDLTQIENLRDACGGLPDTICCRYNPGKFQITNDIIGHLADTKFGMPEEQLVDAFRILRDGGVRHFGIHAMLASCSLEETYYPALARELFSLAVRVREKVGIDVEFIDLSGGIGIPYRPNERAVDIFAIGAGVKEAYDEILAPRGMEVAIFTELGRYMTGPYGYLLTSVIGKKHTYKEYIGVDATACDLMRPAMYGAYHPITVLGREDEEKTLVCDVVGSLCENNDKFAVDRALPQVRLGDILVIGAAGAHGRSMGYNYNGKLRCAEFLLKADGSLLKIRRAETPEDYFATLDVDPSFGG